MGLLKDIGSDQDDILRTLSEIERQLDKILSEGPDRNAIGSSVAFFNNPLLTPDDAFYETKGVRHQVFEKSYKLSQYIEEINQGISDTQKVINAYQTVGDSKS